MKETLLTFDFSAPTPPKTPHPFTLTLFSSLFSPPSVSREVEGTEEALVQADRLFGQLVEVDEIRAKSWARRSDKCQVSLAALRA